MSSHVAPNSDDPTAPPRLCPNCQSTLRGPYCANCGQHDIDYRRSFLHLAHDVLENLFHFDGKFLVSVAWLLGRPGRLTAEFNAGRRASQVPPLRFYIFVTILFFLVVHTLNDGHLLPIDRREADELTGKMRENISALEGSNALTLEQQRELGKLIGEIAQKTNGSIDQQAIAEAFRRVQETASAAANKTAAAAPKPPPAKTTSAAANTSSFEHALKAKLDSGELSVSRFLDQLERRVPTLLFIGMPVFALLLKLLYARRGRFYIEHLVFSVHLHTWAFLVFMVAAGYYQLAALGPDALTGFFSWALVIWMAWYVVAAFRAVYRQSWRRTVLKVLLAATGYTVVLFALIAAFLAGTLALLVYG